MTDNPTAIGIGQAIRQARGGLTLRELAALTGLSLTYLSDMERGRTQPSIKTLLRIANALDVEPGRLLNYCANTDQAELEACRLWLTAFREFLETHPLPKGQHS